MCARYNLHSDPKLLVDQFGVEVGIPMPRFNIAPTQYVPLIRPSADRPGREVASLRWGLIPSWANDIKIGARHINARAETVAEKPAFRAAFKRRRCLVPASGFYEWTGPAKKRMPHLFSMRDARPFAFAGLWEKWERVGEQIESFTILTTEANELCAKYHDRMPVIVHRNDYDLWMTGEPSEVSALFHPYPCDDMTARPLSPRVNNSRNEGPELLDAECA
jgi:putative SOS response-associated peptidase YedK